MPIKELPDDLREHASLKDFNDLPALAKSFIETKAFVGNAIRPPGPDASPEAKKEFLEKLQKHAPNLVPLPDEKDADGTKLFWSKLGVPEKPEGYDVPAVAKDLDLASLRATAQAAGLTKAQFSKLAEMSAGERAKVAEALAQDQAALKTEWGQAYEPKLKAAANVAAKLGAPEGVVKGIQAGQLASAQLKLWDGIAKAVGTEGNGEMGKQGSGQPTVLTPAEAETQINEIMAHPDYWKRGSPKQADLVRKLTELQKFITPEA